MDLTIDLNNYKFKPRDYQLPIIEAVEKHGYKKILCIMARRSGKDITAWNIMIREALFNKGLYVYCCPVYTQARQVLWDAIASDSTNFLDYIPKECISKINNQEMKITLINGSIIKMVGSDNYDRSLVGSNIRMIIFSEWSLADARAWPYVKPILAENNGIALFLSTPRSTNHLFDLYQMALKNKDWFVYFTTVKDTKHISEEQIEQEIERGEISWDLAQQEYYCSFQLGASGSYYHEQINKLKLEGKIGQVPWQSAHPVHTVWDLGLDQSMAVLFFQVIGTSIHIIEAYNKTTGGMLDYIKYVLSKPYIYGSHYGPHDVTSRDMFTGVERVDIARQHGINFKVVPKVKVQEGIEAVRCLLPKTYIDAVACKELIRALENYHRQYDPIRQKYDDAPFKDWSNHMADAMRYLAVIERYVHKGMTPQDVEDMRQKAYSKGRGYEGKLHNNHPQQQRVPYNW